MKDVLHAFSRNPFGPLPEGLGFLIMFADTLKEHPRAVLNCCLVGLFLTFSGCACLAGTTALLWSRYFAR